MSYTQPLRLDHEFRNTYLYKGEPCTLLQRYIGQGHILCDLLHVFTEESVIGVRKSALMPISVTTRRPIYQQGRFVVRIDRAGKPVLVSNTASRLVLDAGKSGRLVRYVVEYPLEDTTPEQQPDTRQMTLLHACDKPEPKLLGAFVQFPALRLFLKPREFRCTHAQYLTRGA